MALRHAHHQHHHPVGHGGAVADDAGGHRHTHDHGPTSASRNRLLIALAILGGFTAVEAVGGYLSNSIALYAEAAHMLADSVSLLLAVLAIRASGRPADERRTYGHRRYGPLAAFINGQVLILLTVWVAYEAIRRLMHPPAVNGAWMLAIALIGGVANVAAFLTLSGAGSLNERGARAHVLSDLLGSAAAAAAALIILATGWVAADPLLSLLVSLLVFRSAWLLMRESADVLLQSVPPGFDIRRIEAELIGQVPGLIQVHHIHAWSMTGERPTVTLHAILEAGVDGREALESIQRRLSERLDVEHTTVQIEEGDGCDAPTCGASH